MIKVIVACGCGMGSSQLIKMKAVEVFKELEINANIHHTSIDEAISTQQNYDVIIVSNTLTRNFNRTKAKIIGLKNIMSKSELKQKIIEAGI